MNESVGVILFLIVLFTMWLVVLSVVAFNIIERIKKLEFRKKKTESKISRYGGRMKW